MSLGQLSDLLTNRLRRVFTDELSALAAMQFGDMRPEQFHVVADFGHRADGGAGALNRIALLDGDGGRDAFDPINLRLVHAIEELPRVGREGLDIAALAFGEQRVERERALARAAQAGNDDQLAHRQIEIEILKVVVPHPLQSDGRYGPALCHDNECKGGRGQGQG